MRSVLAFCAFLVVVLGLLTWGAVLALNTTTRGWFERDVALRAELAVSGSRRALVSAWRAGQWQEVGRVLADMVSGRQPEIPVAELAIDRYARAA